MKLKKFQFFEMEFLNNLKLIKLCGDFCFLCKKLSEEEVVTTKCGHLFCVLCLRRWICKQKAKKANFHICPVCKATITKSSESKKEINVRLMRLQKSSLLLRNRYNRILKQYRKLKFSKNMEDSDASLIGYRLRIRSQFK